MKILQIYKDYYPVMGGVENHIRDLARGLQREGVKVRVLVTNTELKTVQEVIDGVPVVKAGRLLNVSSAPVSPAFYPWLRRLEADTEIAHAHAPYPPGELGQLFLGRSKRFVLTYHSDIVKQRVLGFFYSPFLRQTLRRADLIAVSNPTYIQTSPFLLPVAEKCRVVHFGINVARFASNPQLETEAAALRAGYGNKPLILFLGRLRHYKGVDVLLNALPQIAGAHLLVVGTGPMEQAWQERARDNGLADRVSFLGDCSDEDALAARHAADVFVLPSTNRAETLGIVQLEAMASGVPIVCTELGTGTSYANVDGETGFVVAPSDPAALAAAINQLLGDADLRQRMGAAGLARAATEFSHEAMIRNMMDFYTEASETSARETQS